MKNTKSENRQAKSLVNNNGAHLTRSMLDRLLKIRAAIVGERYPTTASLARELEVTRRTVHRDIEWMKVWWEAPIEFDPHRNGYYYTEPGDKGPGIPGVTEAEIVALLVAYKAVEQYHTTPFHQPLQAAFKKLSRLFDRSAEYGLHQFEGALSFRAFAPERTDLHRFEAVSRGLQRCQMLTFEYRKPGEKQSEVRHVEPYHLICCENLWYLIAWDEARSDFRSFALPRICGRVETGRTFMRRHFNLHRYLYGSLTMLKGDGDYEVVIEFDAWATDLIRERTWHPSQNIVPLPGGAGCHLHMRLTALEEVERWVLSWGIHATVIGPDCLVQRIGKILNQLRKRYPTDINDIEKAA